MKVKIIQAVILVTSVQVLLFAQNTPAPAAAAGSATDIETFTQSAEKNGYVSPQAVLGLKEQLGLTKDQVRKIEEMLKNLPVSFSVKEDEIREAKEDLDKSFATNNINERTLRSKVEHINKLEADYQFMHLQPYLKVKQILSANQWAKIKELQTSEVK